MSEDLIRVAIADSHKLFRQALNSWLSQFDFLMVKLDVAYWKELFDYLQKDGGLDVLILEYNMSEAGNRQQFRQLREKYPRISVLILSLSEEYDKINPLLDLGIYGYISKSAEISELIEAIKAASMHKIHRNKLLTDALYLHSLSSGQKPDDGRESFFSDKQKRILQLLWEEKSTHEIAREVFLSVSAVDKIKQQLKDMTGARSTVGLIKYAIENSIIRL